MFHMQLHPGDQEHAEEYAYKSLIACQPQPQVPIGDLLDIPFADWNDNQREQCYQIHNGYVGFNFDLIGAGQNGNAHPAAQPDLHGQPLDEWHEHDFREAAAVHAAIHGRPGPLNNLPGCVQELQVLNSLGLVRAGAAWIALVRIAGPYEFVDQVDPNDWCWFRHRWPVEILGWFAQDQGLFNLNPTQLGQGACQRLNNINGATYQVLIQWFDCVQQENWRHQQENEMHELVELIRQQRNIVLQGPPGTSKTWLAKRLAAAILWLGQPDVDTNVLVQEYEDSGVGEFANMRLKQSSTQRSAWEVVQFHPAYNYEDFVRGIQVSTEDGKHRARRLKTPNRQAEQSTVRYDTVERTFGEMCKRAQNEWVRATEIGEVPGKFVLIIDEINRANLAAVLGELIYAMEYRGEAIRTPYSPGGDNNYNLTVPKNLYIIGTMNTADRSVGHIDYAVRRRFAFVPMLPRRDVIENYYTNDMAPLLGVALGVFDSVAALFDGNLLSRDFHADDVQPGHTYFLAENREALIRKFVYQVLPLLREYAKDGILVGGHEDLALNINDIPFSFSRPIQPEVVITILEQAFPPA